MKKRIKDRLLMFLDNLKKEITEDFFNETTYEWHDWALNILHSKDISWINICKGYKKHFDTEKEYYQDLKLFTLEMIVLETIYLLKYLYGVETKQEIILKHVFKTKDNACDTAIFIINSLNYTIL